MFLTVAAATMIFAILSRIFLGSPNIPWGYSSYMCVLAFIFWAAYAAVLYSVIKTDTVPYEKHSGIILKACAFGLIASCCNAGLNIIVMQLIKNIRNLILASFLMETEVLLFGSILILFLYIAVGKKQISPPNKQWIPYLSILGGSICVFILAFAVFFSRFRTLEPYTSPEFLADSQINMQALMYMKTAMSYHRNFLTIATIVFFVCFLTLWYALQKNTQTERRKTYEYH